MSGNNFADILTSLYNGRRSEAIQTAETVNEMYDISEDWNRQKQKQIYVELNIKRIKSLESK